MKSKWIMPLNLNYNKLINNNNTHMGFSAKESKSKVEIMENTFA